MLERLTSLFHRKTPAPTPLPEPDARLALGTLLVRVAMADRSYLFEEVEAIDRLLAEAYDLNPLEAAQMRATCEKLAFAMEDDREMAELVKASVDYSHRLEKVQALWKVVMADGITDERETEVVRVVEEVLGVSAEDSSAARDGAHNKPVP